MAYGQTDDIVELHNDLDEALKLLVAIAMETKNVSDVRSWLEEKYPRRCFKNQSPVKKW